MKYPLLIATALTCAFAIPAGATPSATDFRHTAMASDGFEIASSKIALGKSQNPSVKAFARMMIHDHTLTTEHLLKGSGMSKPEIDAKLAPGADGRHAVNDLVDQDHASMLDKLGDESGSQFDSDYISDQVSGHKDAVSMFEDYARNGDDPALKAWARRTLPKLKMHLAKAQGIDKKL